MKKEATIIDEAYRLTAFLRRNKIIDETLKEHYRETMERKRVPTDYLLMFTEGGEANAVADAIEKATLRQVADTLKNYGVSITNEGVLVPYSDEWDYLHDTPRRTLLRGNDKGESCKKLWQALSDTGEEI